MLSHLTLMIAALSLALTAGSVPGWSRVQSVLEHRCSASHNHGAVAQWQRGTKMAGGQRRLHDVQVLSFGP